MIMTSHRMERLQLPQQNSVFILLITFLLVCFPIFSQYEKELELYKVEQDLTKKASLGIKLWGAMHKNDIDSLKKISFELIFLGVANKNDFAIAVGKRSLGSCLIRSGEPDKGIKFLKESLDYFERKEDMALVTEILNEIGNGYLNKGLPLEAEKYYLKSLKAGKDSPEPSSLFLSEINLGQAYIGMKNYDKASAVIQHYKSESLKLGKLEAVANAYALLGTIEQQRRNIPLAMEYFAKSADFGKRSKSKAQIAHALNNMAIVHFEEGDMKKTMELFKAALDIRMKTGNARYIAESYFNIGGLYFELGDYKNAELYYQKCLLFARQKRLRRDEMDAMLACTELYKIQGKEKEVIQLLEDYILLQEKYYSQVAADNSISNEMLESINELEAKRKLEDRQSEMRKMSESQKKIWYIVYGIGGLTFIVLLILLVFKKRIN
jgi:tetratricopeptide (TPR) repeat protein